MTNPIRRWILTIAVLIAVAGAAYSAGFEHAKDEYSPDCTAICANLGDRAWTTCIHQCEAN